MDALDANPSGEAFGVANAIGHSDDQSHSLKSPITGLYDVGNDDDGFGLGAQQVDSAVNEVEIVEG